MRSMFLICCLDINYSLESVRLTGKYCRVCLRYLSITDGPSL